MIRRYNNGKGIGTELPNVPTPGNSEEMMERLRTALDGREMYLLVIGNDGPKLATGHYEPVLKRFGIKYRRGPDLKKRAGAYVFGEYRAIENEPSDIIVPDGVVLTLYDDFSKTGRTLTGGYVFARMGLGARDVLVTVDEDRSGVSDISRVESFERRLGPELYIFRNTPRTYQMLRKADLIPDKHELEARDAGLIADEKLVDLSGGGRSSVIDTLGAIGEIPKKKRSER